MAMPGYLPRSEIASISSYITPTITATQAASTTPIPLASAQATNTTGQDAELYKWTKFL